MVIDFSVKYDLEKGSSLTASLLIFYRTFCKYLLSNCYTLKFRIIPHHK